MQLQTIEFLKADCKRVSVTDEKLEEIRNRLEEAIALLNNLIGERKRAA